MEGGLRLGSRFAVLAEEHLEAPHPSALPRPSVTLRSLPSSSEPPSARATALRKPLVWIDLEMTGLDPDTDVILEIAVAVTDGMLEEIIEGPDLVIHHDEDRLQAMNEWCIKQHERSGLTRKVEESTLTTAGAEDRVIAFLADHIAIGRGVLAGE